MSPRRDVLRSTPSRTQMPVKVPPRSARLSATSTPACASSPIAGAVPMTTSAVSPPASRLRTWPIVPNVNATCAPVSRASRAAKSVTAYFTAPADSTRKLMRSPGRRGRAGWVGI